MGSIQIYNSFKQLYNGFKLPSVARLRADSKFGRTLLSSALISNASLPPNKNKTEITYLVDLETRID